MGKDKQNSPDVLGGRMAQTLDRLVGLVSPAHGRKRLESRAHLKFAYDSVRNIHDRGYPDRMRGPENPLQQRDNIILMRSARELVENSGFFKSIRNKIRDYVIGNTRYFPLTGNPTTDAAIKEWLEEWFENCDATGRFHFLDMIQILIGSTLTDGDHGLLHIVDDDHNFTLQNIEADRIGDPHSVGQAHEDYIRGIELCNGRPTAYHIYHRSLHDTYYLDQVVPADSFTHYYRPDRYDQYRGTSAFASVVGLYRDVKEVRRAEIMSIKWAGSKAGIVKTHAGAMPESILDRGNNIGGDSGKQLTQIAPAEVSYLQPGEDISVISHDRPNPNLMAFMESLLHEGALGLDLPYGFVYNMAGLSGAPTRLVSEQAKRTFQAWQDHLERNVLRPIIKKAILSGIAKGKIPWTDSWDKGKFIFPAHPTVDVGRESAANLNENRQALRTAADIYGEQGKYWLEEQAQIANEAGNVIDLAKQVSEEKGVPFNTAINLIQMMTPNGATEAMVEEDGDEESEGSTDQKKPDDKE